MNFSKTMNIRLENHCGSYGFGPNNSSMVITVSDVDEWNVRLPNKCFEKTMSPIILVARDWSHGMLKVIRKDFKATAEY